MLNILDLDMTIYCKLGGEEGKIGYEEGAI